MHNGSYVWSEGYQFRAPPFPGQDSVQKVVIFGDMGKDGIDGSNEYNNFQRASLNTTRQLVKELKDIDVVFHICDICYANGYLSQWDQFTAQVEPIASTVPYMIASGNHERNWPGSGSFYQSLDSGGECGVPAHNMFYVLAEKREKFWYSTDYGMFRFCIADTEHDWRVGTEQYNFIENYLAFVDRQKQLTVDVTVIFRRRGGDDLEQSSAKWTETVNLAPDVIDMIFVPIVSLLQEVPGVKHLAHAMELYLEYKPPLEDLQYFLEFQIARAWAPEHSLLQRKEPVCQSLQFSLMGRKLYITPEQVMMLLHVLRSRF